MTVYRTIQDAVDSGKKYSLVLADPPWKYKYWVPSPNSTRAACKHYEVMEIPDIAALPVRRLLDKAARLFMWVTAPMTYASREVMEGWGFEFSTIAFVWYKVSEVGRDRIIMGHTSRPSCELVLSGGRGSLPAISGKVHQAVDETRADPEVVRTRMRRRHSQKPDIIADRIVELHGDLPRIELFRRGPPVDGWDAVGYEADAGQGVL